jgi:anti-sigma factor ChrR (cupin superfamily)
MLKCKDVPETVERLHDGKLPLMQRLSLYFHLMMCGNCRRYIRQLNLMLGMISKSEAASQQAAEDDEVAKIMQLLNKDTAEASKKSPEV